MNPWFTRNLIYRWIYLMRGEYVTRFQREVRAFHRLDRAEMDRVQWVKLLTLMKHLAEHNDYYQTLFKQYGIDVNRIQSPDDFAALPLLDKPSLRANEAEMRSRHFHRSSLRRTSGSTGIPVQFVKDREASAYMDALMHEVYGWYGIGMGDRQARVWGMATDWRGRMMTRMKDLLLNRRRLVYYDLSPGRSGEFFAELLKFKPVFLYGMVNPTAEFARALVSAGFRPASLGLKAIITTSEMLLPETRTFLKESFECPIINEYGCSENGIIAFECRHSSMHVMNHNLYVEVINPVTLKPANPGEVGELVITELHSAFMPFVRYRIGDLARLSTRQCSCGLQSPLIEALEGRVTDLIQTPSGRRLSSYLISYCMPHMVNKYRTIQKSLSALEILVTADSSISQSVRDDMIARIRHAMAEEMQIELRQVNDIPYDRSGKLRTFVSEIDSKPK